MQNKLSILFGSQTGTAKDTAERIARMATIRNATVRVTPMDDYSIGDLVDEFLVLLVVSTTGDGDEPDNMKKFFKAIMRKNVPPDLLSNVHYTVIGLGDSKYSKFNFVAKKLHRRFQQLSAACLLDPVYADDQYQLGADGMIDPWLEEYWTKLNKICPGIHIIPCVDNTKPPPSMFVTCLQNSLDPECDVDKSPFAKVTVNNRVTPEDHFQEVRFFCLDISDTHMTYQPGDAIAILPENCMEDVEMFLELLPYTGNEIISVKAMHDSTFPNGTHNFRYWLQKVLDLTYIPKRSFFELVWYYSEDPLEKERLQEFGSANGQQDLIDYAIRPRRTVLEVFADFPHTTPNIPLDRIFDLIPRIRARKFSIASSPIAYPNQVHLLVAIVDFRTILKKPRKGLCTAWLRTLVPNQDVICVEGIYSTSIKMIPGTASIMIGPGTGVAPMRSLIQHRVATTQDTSNVQWLFFGARNASADFFFEKEWKELEEKNQLRVTCAFSRDQPHKIYVQHRLQENEEEIRRLIVDSSAVVYIAGSAIQMVSDVKAVLSKIIGEQCLQDMEKNKHLQIDAWS